MQDRVLIILIPYEQLSQLAEIGEKVQFREAALYLLLGLKSKFTPQQVPSRPLRSKNLKKPLILALEAIMHLFLQRLMITYIYCTIFPFF